MSETTPQQGLLDSLLKVSFTWLLIRGVLAVLFGIVMLTPLFGATVLALFIAVFIGVWLLFDGIISIVLAIRERGAGIRGWGWTLTGGIVGVLAGIFVFAFPVATGAVVGLIVLWTMAIGLIVRGIFELGSRGTGWARWIGVLNIAFGIGLALGLVFASGASLLALVWAVGVYAIFFGVAAIIAAFQVRGARKAASAN